jgi:hypothetical protein
MDRRFSKRGYISSLFGAIKFITLTGLGCKNPHPERCGFFPAPKSPGAIASENSDAKFTGLSRHKNG